MTAFVAPRVLKFAPISDCDVRYTSAFSLPPELPKHAQQTLDVFVPQNFDRLSVVMPVLFFLHGGSLDKESSRRIAKGISRNGVVVVAPHCTLGERDEERLYYSQLASQWIYDHVGWYGGDGNNVSAFGVGQGTTLVQALAKSCQNLIKNTLCLQQSTVKSSVQFEEEILAANYQQFFF